MPGYLRLAFRLWYHGTLDTLVWKLAYAVPRRVALIVFVRVYSAGCPDAPGVDYQRVYKAWEAGAGH